MPVSRSVSVAACLAALFVVSSCGSDDDSGSPGDSSTRTVEIEMRDIEFSPTTLDVEKGETIRFLFRNTGEVAHEAYIGDATAQEEHAGEMESMGGMDHGDDDVLVLDPGQVGDLTHTFTRSGEVQVGCHQPGHFEAGMVLDVEVS